MRKINEKTLEDLMFVWVFGLLLLLFGVASLFYWKRDFLVKQVASGLLAILFGILAQKYWAKYWKLRKKLKKK